MITKLKASLFIIIVVSIITGCNKENSKDNLMQKVDYHNSKFYKNAGESGFFKESDGKVTKINDEKIDDFFIYNGTIIYTLDDHEFGIRSMDVNGENYKRPFQTDGIVFFEDYLKDELIFRVNNLNRESVYSLNLKTLEYRVLYKEEDDDFDIANAIMYEGKLYISSDTETFLIEDGYKTKVCRGLVRFIIDDRIYVDNIGIYKEEDNNDYAVYNLDGTGKNYLDKKEYEIMLNRYLQGIKDNGYYLES